jgi:hypothetical protein
LLASGVADTPKRASIVRVLNELRGWNPETREKMLRAIVENGPQSEQDFAKERGNTDSQPPDEQTSKPAFFSALNNIRPENVVKAFQSSRLSPMPRYARAMPAWGH